MRRIAVFQRFSTSTIPTGAGLCQSTISITTSVVSLLASARSHCQLWPGVAMSLLHHPQPTGSHEFQIRNSTNQASKLVGHLPPFWSFPQLLKLVSIVGYPHINMPVGDDCQWVPVPPTRPLLGRCPGVLRGKRTSPPWAARDNLSRGASCQFPPTNLVRNQSRFVNKDSIWCISCATTKLHFTKRHPLIIMIYHVLPPDQVSRVTSIPIRHPDTLWRLPGLPAFKTWAKGELLHLRPHPLLFFESINII